jgi:alpha,alpha-trehalose-phosphate synthase [UDP-forming]
MKQVLLVTGGIVLAIAAISIAFTFNQASDERIALASDLQYRTRLLAEGLKESVEPYYVGRSAEALQNLVDRYADRERVIGLSVYDGRGDVVAVTKGMPERLSVRQPIVTTAMDSDSPSGEFLQSAGRDMYIFIEPLHEDGRVVGAFMVAQDSGYISAAVQEIWKTNLIRLFLQLFLIASAIALLIRFAIYRPIKKLAETMRSARVDGTDTLSLGDNAFFQPLAHEIAKMNTSLTRARSAASEEARLRLEKLDSPWTSARLKEFIKAYLKDRPIYVVSNREPYVHTKTKKGVSWSVPASGMVTALEPVMEACGGTWIAHGSGTADKETADAEGRLRVPPDEPKYTLKRVFLTAKDVEGHYVGFSNEALWPLCHMAHTRPIFRKEDWQAYRRVNGKFAATILAEIKNVQRPLILVQDYHFALLPAMIKQSRPDAQVALFWHIPWPGAESFSICPFRREILHGMLGADVVGFHTQQYCNNFLDTVAKEVEARIDLERFSVRRGEHETHIKPFPISIGFSGSDEEAGEKAPDRGILERLGIDVEYLGLGVDRLDYTKGILERFKGIEFFLDTNPDFRGKFSFLQIAPVSREGVEKYREYGEAVTSEAERINKKFGSNGWKPIILEKRHYTHAELMHLYRLANVTLVTSLHDGMNLVAKEFVAARDDEAGVLILSHFTGAARDLKGAITVNPYSAEETAEAIRSALSMPPYEQHQRMKAMRAVVRDYNVFRWSAELIKSLANLG